MLYLFLGGYRVVNGGCLLAGVGVVGGGGD